MSSPDLSDAERQAVMAVLNTTRLSLGPELEGIEEAVRRAAGTRHAVGVSSGTTGLHLAVRAAGVADGDAVITTPFSFVASANVILYERATPVFVDIDPATGNIDPVLVRQAAADLQAGGAAARRWWPRAGGNMGRLKVILAVDVFGQPAEFDQLAPTAREHELALIEDACEAVGSSYHGRPAGALGDVGVYAFYPNKVATSGEGGAVVTDRDDWAAAVRSMANQGRPPGDTWLEHSVLGFNYRLDELSAALGRVQMGRLEELRAKRQRVAGWYAARLGRIPGIEAPATAASTTCHSWFVYVIRLPAGADRRGIAGRLQAAGIPTRPYFAPIHLQRYFADQFGYRPGDFPVTEDLGSRSLALPFSGVMQEAQVEEVVEALRRAL